MKKIIFASLLILPSLLLSGCSSQDSGASGEAAPGLSAKNGGTSDIASLGDNRRSEEMPADRVEVYLFHETQRCATCIAIGKYAGEMISERFQGEIKAGKVEFAEINIDLPENKELAAKFKAGGSALHINAIRGGVDDIEQDAKVWRLTGDEAAFKDYLEGRIRKLLGS